ncbi:SNF family Na+-dependent transporter [Schinkia azotoformans MEV2011]|uniref:Transporter n=1 Tax=Schinkia azotoformans MEV2011 TaxID=1348973 RepID=A0A072NS38_SCHAZ|nr:sodium-dependent transporter [Schinkia azotoformans]KEF40037.1 SNF family Na+-dependent transporter [Schinkia azotoformans MEV2011]MEC1694733.1 sodium-dependent transporter [Schinkia azotoformans]MEC1726416.1 sodium-dependent transporter [Schinkia azotoformans]MEC1771010.1 sodium-dependent transporter [Schinkia azotoformans]MEC1780406.1 sodium-dependent transporter [Schinkia azotoformans]
MEKPNHEQWSSKIGFILAAAGSAIGLGAIWKFPYMAGTNGGGVFFLIFILFTVFFGAPMLFAEFIIGRRTQKDAITAYKKLSPNTPWHLVGVIGVISSFVLLSFYSVVGGWILSYMVRSLTGDLSGLSNEQYGDLFGQIISNPWEVTITQLIFLIMTIAVVQGGIQNGIEKANKYMMPSLFILFIILVIRSVTLEGGMEGIKFFLMPDMHEITSKTFIMALGQSFFALSVGLSVMVTYGSYLSKTESLPRSVTSIVSLNIFISLLAGLAIFPAVFEHIAYGSVFFAIFMILLLFATLTSAFSILEIIVATIAKDDVGKRKKVAWIAGILVFLLGIPAALSNGILADFKPLFNKTIFDLSDYFVSNIALPTGCLLIALFVGLKIPKAVLKEELLRSSSASTKLFTVWYWSIRYLVPIGIVIVFLHALGIIQV